MGSWVILFWENLNISVDLGIRTDNIRQKTRYSIVSLLHYFYSLQPFLFQWLAGVRQKRIPPKAFILFENRCRNSETHVETCENV